MKIGIFCSHGGHLTEAQEISKELKEHDVFFVTYNCERTRALKYNYLLPNIGTNPFRMLWAIFYIGFVLVREKPQVIISTGAEVAIPAFYIARVLRIHTVFIESLACIDRPSKTGKIVYLVSNLFLVQWEQLLESYGGKAQFKGSVL